MLRLALKSVRHNPKRLVLTAIAVALGVSLVSATFIFTSALSRGFSDLFSEIYATVDVIVEPAPGTEVDPYAKDGMFSVDVVDEVRQVDGVAAAEGHVAAETGKILDSAGDGPLNPGGAPTLVYNWTGNAEIDRSTLIEGRAPEAPGEAVVDIDTFDKLGIALGESATIAGQDGTTDLTVVGTIRFGEDNSLQTANLIYTLEDTVRVIGGGLTGYSGINVLTDDADAAKVAERIQPILPDGTRAISSEDKVAEQIEDLNDALVYVDIFAVVFGLIALFVGAYIIVNTFRIIVTQRTREFGLLRAIGAQGSQIRTIVLLEAIAVGIVASTLGILMGWGLGGVFALIVEALSGDILGAIVPPVGAVLWGYVMGIGVTLISALLPAIHASTISPMEALREAGTAGKKPLKVRNIVGAAMTLVGVIAVFVGLYASVPSPAYWVGAGAVLIVLGVTLLAAQVLVPMAYGLRGVLTAAFGVNGKLAANNIRREPRRSANTAAALMIGVMLLALVATFTQSIKSTFAEQFAGNEAELILLPQAGPIPQGALDVIADTDGVRQVIRYAAAEATVGGATYSLGIVDAAHAEEVFDFATEPDLVEIAGGVFVDPIMVELGYDVGDEITIEGPDGTTTLDVTGRYLNEGDQNLLIDWETGAELVADPLIFQALIDFEEGVDAAATQQAIEDNLAAEFPLVQVQSPSEVEQFFNQALDILIGVISALLGAALVIAILGVANTLLLSVTERTREIGLLRAVGVKRGAVWGMITLESVVMAVFGTVLGIILGVGLGTALVDSLEEYGFTGVSIPWGLIGVYTVLSMIAGVLAAIWPARRASRLDILQAIAADG